MDKTVEEIYIVLDELLANIGLQLEEFDMSFLTQAELYVEMFKVMFPTLVPLLDIDFSQEDVNDQELIQSLLDFLSKYIIKMDLDHISGELITKGDPKHILNFIQLLSEISKMVVPKDEEEGEENGQIAENYRNFAEQRLLKSAPGSMRLTDQSQNSLDEWKYEKYNSAIGIPGEFHVEGAEGEEMEGAQAEGDSGAEDMGAYSGARGGPYPPVKGQYGQGQKRPGKQESLRNSYSGSRISEVSKSKECSDYEMTAKKLSGVDHQFEDFDPKTDPERQRRLERAAAEAAWEGQNEEEEEDEEIVEEADEDEEDEHTESTAKRQSAHRKSERPKGSQPREEEKYEYEDEYEEQEGEEYEQEDIDQGEEDYQSYPGRKVSKESEEYEGAEYYTSDPINYQSNKRGSSRQAEEVEHEEEEQEEDEDEPVTQDMIQEHYEEEEEEGEHIKDEVIEDEAEYYRQQYQAQLAQAKKQKAARPSTAKPYKAGKVEYRPLRPTTAVTYMSHQSATQAKPPQPKTGVKKTKKKTTKPKQSKQPKLKQASKSTSSRNHISEERISEKSRESTGQDVRGLQAAQQGDSRRVTSKGSKEENSMQRRAHEQALREQALREQAAREEAIRYGESLKRRRLTNQQATMQKTGTIRIKGDTLKKAYEDQQKMLYYNIRDSKLNYLKKIHTIIYQLEKEKIKEERELQRNYIKAQEEATVNILLTIKQSYQEKLDVLRQGYKNEKNERKVNDMAQQTFLKTLSHELKLDQMKEIERLKDRLAQEKMRFDLMTGDEAYLERKLAQLYQK